MARKTGRSRLDRPPRDGRGVYFCGAGRTRCRPGAARQQLQDRTGGARDHRCAGQAGRAAGDHLMTSLKDAAQAAVQSVVKKAIALAPDSFIPGGKPDPLIRHKHGLIGASISRIDGPLKVCGGATFAAEFPLEGLVYAALKYSTIARGR